MLDNLDDGYLAFCEITDALPSLQKHSAKTLDQLKVCWLEYNGKEDSQANYIQFQNFLINSVGRDKVKEVQKDLYKTKFRGCGLTVLCCKSICC